jgi:hypothetical protein
MGAMTAKKRAWVVALGLLLVVLAAACAEVQVAPPPTWPSIVTGEDRVQYYVSDLRVPGTRQEIRTQKGDANLWIPLNSISSLRFTDPPEPERDYRWSQIVLTSGEILRVRVETNQILEGRTEAGYWNMPMKKLYSLELGSN